MVRESESLFFFAHHIFHPPAEINTSSILGYLKEAIVDRSTSGDRLPNNVVIIAACNPSRDQIQATTRERDLGREWASGRK